MFQRIHPQIMKENLFRGSSGLSDSFGTEGSNIQNGHAQVKSDILKFYILTAHQLFRHPCSAQSKYSLSNFLLSAQRLLHQSTNLQDQDSTFLLT